MYFTADDIMQIREIQEVTIALVLGDPGKQLLDRAKKKLELNNRCYEVVLFKVNENYHILYLNQHHIITDGVANAAHFHQLAMFYAQLGSKGNLSLLDQVKYEDKIVDSKAYQTAAEYWIEKSKCTVVESRDTKAITNTERHSIILEKSTMEHLDILQKEKGIRSISNDLTLFSIFAATLLIFRYRLFSKNENTLGVPLHNRTQQDFLGPAFEIGFILVDLSSDFFFKDIVKLIQAEVLTSMKHSLPGISTASTNNSFSWLLNYITASYGNFADLQCETTWLHPNAGDAAHALRLQVHDFNNSGSFTFHFDCSVNKFPNIQRKQIPAIYNLLLNRCINDVDCSIVEHSLVSDESFERSWNYNERAYDLPEESVHHRFFKCVERSPDDIAVQSRSGTLTYKQLNDCVDSFSYKLDGCSVIPLLVPRSNELIVAILAALKQGIPFIPLDNSHPDGRINAILDELGNPALVCNIEQSQRDLKAKRYIFVDVNERSETDIKAEYKTETAYIIFTSGTTGTPKGVEVGQDSLANYLFWASSYYVADKPVDMALYSSPAFDLTLTSVFLPLITGGRVVVYDEETQVSQFLVLDVIEDDRIDLLKLTPSHLQLALSTSRNHQGFRDRRLGGFILGGENLSRSLAMETLRYFGEKTAIYNEYGPTEATIGCMIHRFDPKHDNGFSVPIGKPIPNTEIHLIDKCAQAVPNGFEGEITISGKSLALRYWCGEKIIGSYYASGDRAIRLNNCDLLYLGRLGSQIKFRGARVELAEIEYYLSETKLVEESSVVIHIAKPEKPDILCTQCGISSKVPRIIMSSENICNVCRDFAGKREALDSYFKDLDTLKKLITNRVVESSSADCIVLASGGKDSSYALCKIVEMGFNPVIFTLDNGYLSEHALDNIQRLQNRFDLKWVRQCPVSMKVIFSDSLSRHSNVCDGCFKTIYTMAINYAVEHSIPSIITGLSRGQLFETRLMDMVNAGVFNETEIDKRIAEARLAYHNIDDAVSLNLDVKLCREPSTFDKIQFLDFYRYCDVSLDSMLSFLENFGGWKRPPDTGRSTNCLINDVGIYVHQHERKHHNYAIPYAWDVRMGHKNRLQAIDELNDNLDMDRVSEILKDIDYEPMVDSGDTGEPQLVAYYTSRENSVDLSSRLRKALQINLPDYSIPTAYIKLQSMPLTSSGKIDKYSLPAPDMSSGQYEPPDSEEENAITLLWQSIFNRDRISVTDNFFALGGDSIAAVQISAAARNTSIEVAATDIFANPTIRELANIVRKTSTKKPISKAAIDPGLEESELADLLSMLDRNTSTNEKL